MEVPRNSDIVNGFDLSKMRGSRVFRLSEAQETIPLTWPRQTAIQRMGEKTRLLIGTDEKLAKFMIKLISFYPEPFYYTLVIPSDRPFLKSGRYYSQRGLSRYQVSFFLEHFEEFLQNDGINGVWVTSEQTGSIIVLDSHSYFFAYDPPSALIEWLEGEGYAPNGSFDLDFRHAHVEESSITPGAEELSNYTKWTLRQLEYVDVYETNANPFKKAYLKVRSWWKSGFGQYE